MAHLRALLRASDARRHCCVIAALVLLAGRIEARADEALLSTGAVRRLSPEAAARGLPVKVTGVLTWFETTTGAQAVLHDGSEGIYIRLTDAELDPGLAAGQRAEITGVTAPGGYAPIIDARRVRLLGVGEIPAAIPVSLEALQSGAFDCQRVELRGVVQLAARDPVGAGYYLRMGTLGGRCGVNYAAPPGFDPATAIDAEVRVRGVCFPFFNPRRELLGVRLGTSFPEDLQLLTPPPKWSEIPVTPLHRLQPFSPSGESLHRRRVQGVVTFARLREFFCLQDGARAMRVNSTQPEPLAIGERVEALGFVNQDNFFAELVEASFFKLGKGEPPAPVNIRASEVEAGDFDARLVHLTGELRRSTTMGREQRFFLEADNQLFEATLDLPDAGAAQWREGSILAATGIMNVLYRGRRDRPQFPDFAGFRLQLRNAGDLRLMRAAPWWTKARLIGALAALGVVLLASIAWVHLLRRRVEKRTDQLGAEIRARHHSRVEYEATLRERSRLAGDLHDTVEQAFTAVSFQFQTARALRDRDPARAEHHLALAEEFLSRSRDELRRSVWDLRAQVLEGRTLADSLRHLATGLADTRDLRCKVLVEGERALPELIAGHLFLFAQEALNNTLKHARASHVIIRLTGVEDEVQLAIEDDGCGFEPDAAPGLASGHFGLTGLRERVHRLGGTLRIESAPGQGTRLEARVRIDKRPEVDGHAA